MFKNITTGLGKRPRVAQAYAAMNFDAGVEDFIAHNPVKKS